MATKSRFFAGSSSDDSSSSNSDSDLSSDDENDNNNKAAQADGATKSAAKWAIDSDTDSDDDARVVKSEKDKRLDNIVEACNILRNKIRINDWSGTQAQFLVLQKAMDAGEHIVKANGVPRAYLSVLCYMQDQVQGLLADKARFKKLSKANSKAVNRMRFHFKKTKHITDYFEQMEEYRANPDVSAGSSKSGSDSASGSGSSSSSSGSDSDSDSDSDSGSDGSDSGSGSDDDVQWDNSSDDSSSSDEEDGPKLTGRARWLKKVPTEAEKAKQAEKEEQKRKRQEEREKAKLEREKLQEMESKKVEKKEEALTPKILAFKLQHIVAQRGKKGTNVGKQIDTLRKLAAKANTFTPRQLIPVLMYYVSAQFDTIKMIDAFMSKSSWSECHRALVRVLESLSTEPNLKLGPIRGEDLAIAAAKTKSSKKLEEAAMKKEAAAGEDGESKEAPAAKDAKDVEPELIDLSVDEEDPNMLRVPGDLGSFVERLSQDFTKSLQQTDPNSREYVERLNNEAKYLELSKFVQEYYERHGEMSKASRMALLRISHMYYKHDAAAQRLHEAAANVAAFGKQHMWHPACKGKTLASLEPKNVSAETVPGHGDASRTHPGCYLGPPKVPTEKLNVASELTRLAKFVFKHGNAENGDFAKASLCQVYYHALHDRYHKARDLLLMSRITDSPASFSIDVQILYNRTITQIGLCAFRVGLYKKAQDCLSEICGRNKQKELLAQGINFYRGRGYERDLNAERAEKRRQMPYHHHINLEMIEVFQLTAAMIHEVPWMAAPPSRYGRWKVSPNFQRLLDNSERQVFNGPPETAKEHIYAAVRALRNGDWKLCSKYVFALDRIWNLVPRAEEVKADLTLTFKKAALRTFLFTFSTHYESMSLSELAKDFALDEKLVHAIVSKMMIADEIPGSWDQPTNSIVLHKREPTKLQELALQYVSDTGSMGSLTRFVQSNEAMLQDRMGGGNDGKRDYDRGYHNGRKDRRKRAW